MSDQANQPSQTPEPERAEHASASNRPAPRSQTRTVMYVAIGIIGLFLVLLAIGVIPRIRNHQELAAAAQKAQNNVPGVYVVRPQAASEADLTLAATTQAIQDSIIYARTSGYLRKRYVDIGDRVTAGQLLAEIESPEIYQQLQQAQADLQAVREEPGGAAGQSRPRAHNRGALRGGGRGRRDRQAGARSERFRASFSASHSGCGTGQRPIEPSQCPALAGVNLFPACRRALQRHGYSAKH